MIDPTTGLVDWHVDLFYDDQWNEITDDVLVTDTLRITRGRSDYEGDIPPSQCSFVLDNTTGTYSPKNPYSPLYGKIGRNQPVRVRVGVPDRYWRFVGDSALTTADTAGEFSPQAANLRLEFEIEPDTWRPNEPRLILAKGANNPSWSGLSWFVRLASTGEIEFLWYRHGANTIATFIGPVVAKESMSKAFALEWSADGFPSHPDTVGYPAVGFWLADSFDDLSTNSDPPFVYWFDFLGGSDLDATAEPFAIGADGNGTEISGWAERYKGTITRVRVSTPDTQTVLTDITPSEPSGVIDTEGRQWSTVGDVLTEDRSVRFTGDVQAWPARWGQPDGADAHVPITAYGVRRRLGRTVAPLRSAFRRSALSALSAERTLAYWPMEDGEGARHFASAIGDYPMLFGDIPGFHIRDIELAADSSFVASEPLPRFGITAGYGRVPPSQPTGDYRIFALVKIPDDGIGANEDGTQRVVDLLTLHMSGTISEWTLQVDSDGDIRFRRKRASDGAVGYSPWVDDNLNGRLLLHSVRVHSDGTDAFYGWSAYEVGSGGWGFVEFTRTSTELGFPLGVTVGDTGDLAGTVVGHVALWNRDTDNVDLLWDQMPHALSANAPEEATARVARLLAEEGLPVRVLRSPIPSEEVGTQEVGSTFDVIDEAAAADLAVFADERVALSMLYRPRGSLYNQNPVVLDYEAGHVVAPFEPTDDDEPIANDVTVQRQDGSSSRAVQETGPLSVADPPDGVGRYDESVTVNVASDVQLPNQAGWRLHMGTIDEVRYPTLTVSLNGSPELIDRLLPVDIGDRVQVHNLPIWVPPDMADLIVQGYTEESDGIRWTLTFNCTPASAWSVGVADDSVYGRADTAGSHVLYGVDATAQMLPVLTTDGPRWVQNTDADSQFPFDVTVGGEDITVTNIHPLLSDDFIRGNAGMWDDPVRGLWDNTFIWSA